MSDTIIVTGFGPFGVHQVNASWEAVQNLPENINGFRIIKKEIPVEYAEVEKQVPLLWNDYNPLLIIHVGVSGEAKKIIIEQCAYRDGYQKCDSSGKPHATGIACETGKECIFTEISVKDICSKLNQSGQVEACLSTKAGRYLCEYIYYTSLNINRLRTLFVHVPPLDLPYSAKQLANGLLEIIECALEQLSDRDQLSANVI